MNAVIGYNGTGKTRLLSNLAIVASGTGYGEKADVLAETAGRFVDRSPPFKTVIVMSYSAFDTFAIPPRNQNEKTHADDDGKPLDYVYCGLRERADAVGAPLGSQASYRLLTQAEIEAEFLAALSRVRKLKRLGDLMAIVRPLLRDASFLRIGITPLYAPEVDDDLLTLFQSLSSGHKFVLKVVAELTAYVNGGEPTLVLIDEPETHLHPPLLAALLKSIRTCLDRFDGYAVIVTHSPVVLQEMPSRYVHVLKRVGEQSEIAQATIETFGESIGVITQDVFNLDDGSTDWHDTLVDIARSKTLDELDVLFGRSLGFGARSYVVSALTEDGQIGE